MLLLDEPEHMRQRKLMLPSFHGERMQSYGELMREITDSDIDGWPVGSPFPLRTRTQEITLEIIMRAVFGVDDGARLGRLRDALKPLLDIGTNQLAMVAIAFPFMRRTAGKRMWDKFLRLRAEADEVIFDEIGRRREDPTTPDRDDVLSILLQARDEQGAALTDAELRDELMTLLVAGHETTATSIAWAFDLLLHNPDKLARLQEELAAGRRRVPRGRDQGDTADPAGRAGRRPQAHRASRAAGLRAACRDAGRAEHLPDAHEPGRVSGARAVRARAVPRQRRRHLFLDPVRRRHPPLPGSELRDVRDEGS